MLEADVTDVTAITAAIATAAPHVLSKCNVLLVLLFDVRVCVFQLSSYWLLVPSSTSSRDFAWDHLPSNWRYWYEYHGKAARAILSTWGCRTKCRDHESAACLSHRTLNKRDIQLLLIRFVLQDLEVWQFQQDYRLIPEQLAIRSLQNESRLWRSRTTFKTVWALPMELMNMQDFWILDVGSRV